jgi:predicted alpha-1,2-mannosidase
MKNNCSKKKDSGQSRANSQVVKFRIHGSIHWFVILLLWASPSHAQTAFFDFNIPGQYVDNFNQWNDNGTGTNGSNYSFAENTTAGVGGSGGISVFQNNDTTATYENGSWNFSTNGAILNLSVLVQANGQSSGDKLQFGILNSHTNGFNSNAGVSFESFRFVPSSTTVWSLREQYRTANANTETTLGNVNVSMGHWYKFVIGLTNTIGISGEYNSGCALYDYGSDGLTPGFNLVNFATVQVHTTAQTIAMLAAVWPGLRAYQDAGINAWDNFLVYTPASPPVITYPLINTNVVIGSPATFKVLADGPGLIAYSWFTNNVLIAGATNYIYNAPPISSSFTNLMVVASNDNGSVTNFAIITPFPPSPAVVATAPATNILSTSATLNGQVISTGGDTPAVTLYYGPTDGGTDPAAWAQSVSLGVQTGTFSAGVAGLAPVTTYYFTVMATNATGVFWAASSDSFTTTLVSPSLTSYVNPFIGTSPSPLANYGFSFNTGDVFPGADYPMGMFQFSPDTPSNQAGGYWYPDTTIKGFSLRHFSGRGLTCYLDFEFKPFLGTVTASPQTNNSLYWSGFSHTNESASPGYYSVLLNSGVRAELTTTMRTGMGKFTFPNTNAATLLIDAGSSVNGTTTNTSINIVGTNQIQGFATSHIGGGSQSYTLYFVAQFDRGFSSSGTWNGGAVNPGTLSSTGAQVGAFLTFDATSNPVVYAKIGISFVSIANALANLNAENTNWDFTAIQSAADQAWNNVLNKIVVSGGTIAQMQTFYTALYHCFFHPNVFNDANGQYMGMDKQVHTVATGHSQYENISGWDISRSGIPLRAFLSPSVGSDIAQSEVNWAQQGGGGLPRWQQCNRNSGGEVGDGPVIIVADAYAMGATNFDTASALAAMKLNAGTIGTTSDGNTVRSGLNNYISLGYVPNDVSSTLEYCGADFALYQFSQALGDSDPTDVNYLNRSGNWQNLFNPTNNLIQCRNSDGSWVANITPNSTSGYTEGSAIQYTWMVPFNLNGLFNALGGNSNVVPVLDNFFQQLNSGPNGGVYEYAGNEPCESDPWIYDYAGEPWATQNTIRRIQTQCFTNTPSGFPGNDDGGAISSWYVFSALGFYPEIPGTGGFVIASPMFPRATINLENGHQVVIQGNNATAQNSYVQSLTINGTNSTSLWLPFATLCNGATLIFNLGNVSSSWGTGAADAPPSFDNVLPASAPIIAIQPQPVALYSGQAAAVFSVTAVGTPPLSYQWFTNNTVALSDNANRIGSTTNVLTIPNPSFADAGNYTVVVTNNFGSVTSVVAMLTILTTGLTNFTLNFGGTPVNQGVGADWNTANNWNPGGQAASVSAYPGSKYEVVVGSRLRTPAGTNDSIFPGGQLTIDGNGNFENGTLNTVGELRFKNNSTPSTNYFNKLVLNGGQLDNGGNTGNDVLVVIQGQMNVATNSTIYVDTGAALDRSYQIDSWLTGSGNLFWHQFSGSLSGVNLQVTCTSNTFNGQWIVDQGVLVGVGANSLGTNNIIVGTNGLTAAIETLYDINNTNGSLVLGANGQMFLHQNDRFASVIVNGTAIASGTYTFTALNSAYPANFPSSWTLQNGSSINTGSGQITVWSAPPVPAGLTAIAGNSQVSLSWISSAGAMSYNVKYSTTNGGSYLTITNTTGTSYLHAGLTNGGTYYYVVSAVNAVDESDNSSQVSVTIPTVLQAGQTSINGQFTLKFQGMDGVSYTIETSTNLANWTPLFTSLLTNDQFIFTDTNATNPAQFYRVKQ